MGAHAEDGSERVDRRGQFERVAIARAALHQLGREAREAGPIRLHGGGSASKPNPQRNAGQAMVFEHDQHQAVVELEPMEAAGLDDRRIRRGRRRLIPDRHVDGTRTRGQRREGSQPRESGDSAHDPPRSGSLEAGGDTTWTTLRPSSVK